jgi:hypothetical protein
VTFEGAGIIGGATLTGLTAKRAWRAYFFLVVFFVDFLVDFLAAAFFAIVGITSFPESKFTARAISSQRFFTPREVFSLDSLPRALSLGAHLRRALARQIARTPARISARFTAIIHPP